VWKVVEDHLDLCQCVGFDNVITASDEINQAQVKRVCAFFSNGIRYKHIQSLLGIELAGIDEIKHSNLQVLVQLYVHLKNFQTPNTKLRLLFLIPVFEKSLQKPFGEVLVQKVGCMHRHWDCLIVLTPNDLFMTS
jgi:hypothetical protein